MRLYFRNDLEFTYYGHAIATRFKRDMGLRDDDLNAMVGGRSYYGFLSNQQDIRYRDPTVYQDLMWSARSEPPDVPYLNRVEQELGIGTLWRLFDADRSIQQFNYQQALSAMTIFLKYFEREFEDHRPDAVISFVSANLSALACYFVARRLHIPYLEFAEARLRGRGLIIDNPFNQMGEVEKRYAALRQVPDHLLLRDADEYLRSFRERPSTPDGMDRWIEETRKKSSLHPRRLAGLARVIRYYYWGDNQRDVATDSPLRQVVATLRVYARRRRIIERPVYRTRPPIGEQYAYYTLHHQPELTTMIWAPYWQDQLALIENIARSLPVRMRLYVKEHQTMLGLRPLSYYDRLMRIPNVRLVDPLMSSQELARNASVVLTITGTVGWEALMLGVPVITFGSCFYNAIDAVQKCRAIEDLPSLIRTAVEDPPDAAEQTRFFLAALLAESFPFDHDVLYDPTRSYASVQDSEGARTMYREYRRSIEQMRAGFGREAGMTATRPA